MYSEQPTVLLALRHLNTMLLTNFENLNSTSNIFQETHSLLVLGDPVIICIYLRTTDRHFRDQGNVRHLTSKFLKCDLVQTFNTFRNPSLWIFVAGKASVVIISFVFTSKNRYKFNTLRHIYGRYFFDDDDDDDDELFLWYG